MREPPRVPPIVALAPCGTAEPGVVVAACRAGALGVFDFGIDFSAGLAVAAIERAAQFVHGLIGLRIPAGAIQATLLRGVSPALVALIGTEADGGDWEHAIAEARVLGCLFLADVTSVDTAHKALNAGADGLILSGMEAGGLTGSVPGLELLRGVTPYSSTARCWLRGGIGPALAAVARSAGAEGVVLDSALLLARESPLSAEARARLTSGAAEESVLLGEPGQPRYRLIPRSTSWDKDATRSSALNLRPGFDVATAIGWGIDQSWPVGLDATFAFALARRFVTVGRIVQEVGRALREARPTPSSEVPDSVAGKTIEPAVIGLSVIGGGVQDAREYWETLILDRDPLSSRSDSDRAGTLAEAIHFAWRDASYPNRSGLELATRELTVEADGSARGAVARASRMIELGHAEMVAVGREENGLAAAVVIKDRACAERDGDHIYALLRESARPRVRAESGSGTDSPSTTSRAISERDPSPERIQLLECSESEFLGSQLASRRDRVSGDQELSPIFLGSFPEADRSLAGLMGLIRSSLALYHRILPPTTGVSIPRLSSACSLAPFAVLSSARPWPIDPDQSARRALVATTARDCEMKTLILESYDADPMPSASPVDHWPSELYVIRGADRADIADEVSRLQHDLDDLGGEWSIGPPPLAMADDESEHERTCILAIVASSSVELEEHLGEAARRFHRSRVGFEFPEGLAYTESPPFRHGQVAWLFPSAEDFCRDGYRELAVLFPVVREMLEAVDREISKQNGEGIGEHLSGSATGPEPFEGKRLLESSRGLMAALRLSLVALLKHVGLEPDMLAGIGFGELVALHVAGSLPWHGLISECITPRQSLEPAREVEWLRPFRPVYCQSLGALYPADPSRIAAQVGHIRDGYEHLTTTIESMYADGARVFVEVGPGDRLVSRVEDVLGNRPHKTIALAPRDGGLREWLDALAELTVAGIRPRLGRLWEGRSPDRVALGSRRRPPFWSRRDRSQFHSLSARIDRSPVMTRRSLFVAAVATSAQNELGHQSVGHDFASFQATMRSFLHAQRDEMLEFISTSAVTTAEPPPEVESARDQLPIVRRRFERKCRDAPLPAENGRLNAGGIVLITDDGRGIARAVAADLKALGHPVVRVKHGVSDSEVEGVNLCSPTSVAALLDRVRSRGPLTAIVHLLPLRLLPRMIQLDDGWASRFGPEVRGLFLLARASAEDLEQAAERGGACLIAASGLGGSFGLDDPSALKGFPGQGALRGFIQGLTRASTKIRVRAVDLDPDQDVEVLAANLVHEVLTDDKSSAVGYRNGRRMTPGRVEAAPHVPQGDAASELAGPIVVAAGSSSLVEPLADELAGATRSTVLALVTSRNAEESRAPEHTVTPANFNDQHKMILSRDLAAIANALDEWRGVHGAPLGLIHVEQPLVPLDETETPLESFDRLVSARMEGILSILRAPAMSLLRWVAFVSVVPGEGFVPSLADEVSSALRETLAAWLASHIEGRVACLRLAASEHVPWTNMVVEELTHGDNKAGTTFVDLVAGTMSAKKIRSALR
jgi:NAD(P)H-dependent flavin oxidoreductase YrpB (nitropropane dioxygenase family)